MAQVGLLDAVEVAAALREGRFVAHHQAIVRLPGLEVVGVEALARWEHPVRGVLAPAWFLHTAERAGLLTALDAQIRSDTAQRRHELPGDLYFNVSALDLVGGAFRIDPVLTELRSRVVLELSERVDDVEAEELGRAVAAAQELGMRVALDDFGVDGSSLRRLGHLPVDVLKLDAQLVARLTPLHDRTWAIVDAIVRLASRLGATVIAEGVERPEQLEALVELGCPLAQGYLLHRPEPALLLPAGSRAPRTW
jgi:EAL domain-containing protein (putative c-di-GMP-specific phosphodiesterase class I)